MNNSAVYETIMRMVRMYAKNIHLKNSSIFDIEDIEQELFIHLIKSLEKFDIRKGNVLTFTRNILQQRSNDIIKAIFTDKRRIILKCQELTEETYSISTKDEFQDEYYQHAANKLPKTYQEIILDSREMNEKKFYRKWKLNEEEFQKILSLSREIIEAKESKEERKMKNISCIELLTTRELSKLNETDLYDLSIKINETSDWIKQVKEKLETAIQIKYETEALNKMNKTGENFGTITLQKDNYDVTVKFPKKVVWDQEKLAKIYEAITTKDIFTITYNVDEKTYNQLGEEDKKILDEARTVNYGTIKIKIGKSNNENN